MTEEVKKWSIKYDHKDGRKGVVEVTTEVGKSGASRYGNGKAGMIQVKDSDPRYYDLRYNHEPDLHMLMIEDYFGEGLVKVTQAL